MKQHHAKSPISDSVKSSAFDDVTLPEASDLERAVLGALILEVDKLSGVREIIDVAAFNTPANAVIYGEMCKLDDNGQPIDLYSLAANHTIRQIDGIGRPSAYLAKLTTEVGSGVAVEGHAQHLASIASLRRLVLLGVELSSRAQRGEFSPDDLADWISGEVAMIASSSARVDELRPLSTISSEALQHLEGRQKSRQRGECVGVATGLQRLDARSGGWRAGQLIILAGRPGMGKSAVMLHFARAAAKAGVPVCIFSLEMPAEQLAGRMLVGGSCVDATRYRTGEITSGEWRQLEVASEELSGMPIYINDRAGMSMRQIRAQCRVMQKRGNCGMVIIDYLQLLEATTSNRNSTREREVAEMSRSAKLLAKEFGVPVILLSQLSRKIEERADRSPQLSDLRESGAIEQDADMVLFIDRPALYDVKEIATANGVISSDGVGILHVAKNREGGLGRIYFRHNDSLTRIAGYEVTQASTEACF